MSGHWAMGAVPGGGWGELELTNDIPAEITLQSSCGLIGIQVIKGAIFPGASGAARAKACPSPVLRWVNTSLGGRSVLDEKARKGQESPTVATD